MIYLIVAYVLIAVVLSGYGISLWRRLLATRAEISRLDLRMDKEHPPFGRGER